MALTLPISTTIIGNATTTPDYTLPSGIESGDFIVVVCSNEDTGGPPGAWNDAITSGWTLKVNEGSGVSDAHIGIYTKEADGTEGGTTLEVSQDSSFENCATVFVLRGAVATSLHVIGTWAAVEGTQVTASAIDTGSTDDCYILGICTFDGSLSSTTGPPYDGFSTATGGWSKDFYSYGTADGDAGATSHAIFTKTQVTAGSTGDLVVDTEESNGLGAMQIAIAPAIAATYQYGRPMSDVLSGLLWKPAPSTYGLYNKIDETVASDSEYIYYELGK